MERDPATGVPWKDRHGVAFGKKLKKEGNVEAFLNYGKLHRTGKLLRGLSSKVITSGLYRNVVLTNRVGYAEDHEEGQYKTKRVQIKAPYVRGGASTVITGGKIVARPFMHPSEKVLKMPWLLVNRKIRSFGWTIGAE